jgi:hypothetical protein
MELPKSYENTMKRVLSIKKLKTENKSKSITKHKNYHMIFQNSKNKFLTLQMEPNQENKNVKSCVNVFRTSKGDNLFTSESVNQNHQTISNSNLFSPINSKNNTGTNFYKSFSGTGKSFFPFVPHKTERDYNEEDDQALISIYQMQVTDPNKNNIKDYLRKEEKKQLLERFNMSNQVNLAEKDKIIKIIDRPFENKNDFSKTLLHFSRPHGKIHNYYYEDPFKSLKNLKLNKQIYENVNLMRQEKQIQIYEEHFQKEHERYMKTVQMPRIKESKSQKSKILFEKKPVFEQNKIEESLEINNNSNNQTGEKDEKKHISRDQLIQNIEFYITFKNYKLKPKSRSSFTLTMHENKLFLFGGMNSERLCDIWVCELKGNIINIII